MLELSGLPALALQRWQDGRLFLTEQEARLVWTHILSLQSHQSVGQPGPLPGLQVSPPVLPQLSPLSYTVIIFRYAETDTSTLEDSQSVWRRSSVPLLQSWDTRRPGGSDTTSLATEPGAYCDNRSQVTREPGQGQGPGSDGRTLYIWDRTIVKLRNGLKRNKVRGSPGQNEPQECVRLSTDTTSEDFV